MLQRFAILINAVISEKKYDVCTKNVKLHKIL